MRLKRILAVPDIHFPFHDKIAIQLMIEVAKDFKPHEVVFLGDVFDFYSASRFEKNPEKDYKLFYDEIKEARQLFQELLSKFQKVQRFTMCEGNHEKRLEKYIAANAPKLGGLFRTNEVLGIPNEVVYLPYGRENHYKVGKLIFTHGSRAGENPAASMVKKYRSSVLFGHVHRLQEYTIADFHGNQHVGLTPGWLGNERKAAEYIHDVSEWSKGFALTWHRPNGDFYYQLVKIQERKSEYSCLFNGEVYVR